MIYQPYLDATGAGAGSPTSSSASRTAATSRSTPSSRAAAKPAHVLQLLFYAEQVARIPGAPVERVHVENGLGERETFRVASSTPTTGACASGSSRRSRATDDVPVAVRPLRDLRLPPHVPRAARATTTTSRSSRGCVAAQAETLIDVRGSRRSRRSVTSAEADARRARAGDGDPAGDVRDGAPPGRAAAARPRDGRRYLCELLPDQEERGFRLLPEPDAGRRLVRHRGPSVLRDRARARVPVRLLLPRRRRRGRLRRRSGARDRDGERARSSGSSTGSSSAAVATRACTSTTTPPTSARR